MSLDHNPKIVTNGLEFYYDMGNTKKSWKGRPTTNLIGPNNNATNIYMPSNRPYSGLPHSQSGNFNNNITTEVPPPVSGQTVYKIIDDGLDSQNARYSIRVDMRNTWIDYDKPYIWSAFAWLPSEYAGRWTGTFNGEVYQNSIGTDWHGVRGFSSQYNYYGAGGIKTSGPYGDNSGIDITKLDQWQRIWVVFTPTTANIQIPENGGNDNNIWAAGFMRININNAVNGGTPYHLYLSGGQIEEGNFVTDFVTNSRPNTEAILDLTNNNTITANSLTYNDVNTFNFNGTTDFITIPQTVLSSTGSSVSAWIYIDDFSTGKSSTGRTFIRGANNFTSMLAFYNGGYGFETDTNSNPHELAGRTSGNVASSVITAGSWFHFTLVFSSETFIGYVNGVQTGSATISNNLTFNRIGDGNGFADNYPAFFKGNISALSIYNRALTATEVAQNFTAIRRRFDI